MLYRRVWQARTKGGKVWRCGLFLFGVLPLYIADVTAREL